jgi:hypothetical protein
MRAPYAKEAGTVTRLQEGVRDGLPVLIPGARETHTVSADATAVLADPVAASARAAVVFDRFKADPEPETKPPTLLARIWRRVFRGPE